MRANRPDGGQMRCPEKAGVGHNVTAWTQMVENLTKWSKQSICGLLKEELVNFKKNPPGFRWLICKKKTFLIYSKKIAYQPAKKDKPAKPYMPYHGPDRQRKGGGSLV